MFTWKFWYIEPFTEFITEVVAVFGQQIICSSRPLSTEFSNYLIYLENGKVCFP